MQDDRSEPPPSAGQTIPYEDYSAASTEEEDGTTERSSSMKPHHSSKGTHKKTTKQQRSNARPSRKRSSSSISSSSSSDSSSSSSIFSSSDDDNSDASDGDNNGPAGKKKKKKKKAASSRKKQPSSRGGQQTNRGRGGGTDTADDGSINKLISVALKSQKKQYKNQIIQSVKSDLMNTLRSRIVQQQQRGKKTKGGGVDDVEDEDGGGETTVDGGGGSTDKEYRKRIKQAYKEHEEGYDDAPKFNSKHHKKTIGSILSKLGEVNDIELLRIPHIDKEMGLDRMEISAKDTKLSKKILSASPDKTIPEAVYAALKDAYSSCMLYKYFFKRIFPYITVPYITSK